MILHFEKFIPLLKVVRNFQGHIKEVYYLVTVLVRSLFRFEKTLLKGGLEATSQVISASPTFLDLKN